MQKQKPHVNVVVIGHVDSGKSTTSGHLVYKCGVISERQLKTLEKQSAEQNKASFKFAWIMDKVKSSRERGITIDISHIQFNTPHLDYTIIDAPGHRDFIKNMITGTAQADCALLMISSKKGQFEAGISKDGQTREHILLAYTLGVKQVIVAFNKMDDQTVNYSQDRYEQLKIEVSDFLKKVGYKIDGIPFVPISGWTGQNMFEKSEKLAWYKGPTLLEALDSVVPPKRPTEKPLRVPIQDVFKVEGHGTIATGRVQTGVLKQNTNVTISPGNLKTQVKSIEMHHEKLKEAPPGFNVGMNLKLKANQIKRGFILGETNNNPPQEAESFVAQLIVMNHPGSIHAGYTPIIDLSSSHVACKIVQIRSRIDRKTNQVLEQNPDSIKNGESAIVLMKPEKPLCCEVFSEFPSLGRFAVRDMKQTVAVGVIKEVNRKQL